MSHTPSLKQHMVKGQTQTPNAITEKHSEVRAHKGKQIVFWEIWAVSTVHGEARNVPEKQNLIFILQITYLTISRVSFAFLPPMAFLIPQWNFSCLIFLIYWWSINRHDLSCLPLSTERHFLNSSFPIIKSYFPIFSCMLFFGVFS